MARWRTTRTRLRSCSSRTRQASSPRTGEIRRLADLLLFNDVPYRGAQVLETAIQKKIVNLDDKLYEKLANCWIAAGEYDKRLRRCSAQPKWRPPVTLFMRLGEVQVQREDWPAAIAALQRGLDKGQLRDPGNAQLMIGIAHYSQKNYTEARPFFERSRASRSGTGRSPTSTCRPSGRRVDRFVLGTLHDAHFEQERLAVVAAGLLGDRAASIGVAQQAGAATATHERSPKLTSPRVTTCRSSSSCARSRRRSRRSRSRSQRSMRLAVDVQPLLQRMFDDLVQFVATTFRSSRTSGRANRTVARAHGAASSATASEKYRRLMEAYQIELEYGRTMSAYKQTLATAARPKWCARAACR